MARQVHTGQKSNKSRGDAFRDKIYDICVAAGYKPIKEFKVNGKDSDCIFDVERLPETARIAIEAKHYQGNISKKTAEGIIGSYKNAVERREITEVWVVASKDFTADSRDTLIRNTGFYPISYADFISKLINFPKYIERANMEIEQESPGDCYIYQNFVGQGDAINYLHGWYSKIGAKPIAVLSPYGMGKSSLARKFTGDPIQKWKQDKSQRIPIFISLGQLSSQQEVEGLVGNLFTKDIQVHGYSFPLFQKLNQLGHFVIILDGLDEMRHAMTWDDFKYNFSQLSRIIFRETKCILLGRPNTFQTNKEYESVIKGKIFVGNQAIIPSEAVEFLHCELEPFSDANVDHYFEGYLNQVLRRSKVSREKIRSRVAEIRSLDMHGMFSRPVHAKMMAEIASDLNVTLKKFTRFELYESFMTTTLERDFRRHRGNGVTPEQRRNFLQRLAWENWIIERDSFKSSQVDRSWFAHFAAEVDADGLKREFLSGSIIETKLGDVFYFSHRSFQEFLVAEFALEHPDLMVESQDVMSLRRYLTPEISEFISETSDPDKLRDFVTKFIKSKIYNVEIWRNLYRPYLRLLSAGIVDPTDQSTPMKLLFSLIYKIQSSPAVADSELEAICTRSTHKSILPEDVVEFVIHQLPAYCDQIISPEMSERVTNVYLKIVLKKMAKLIKSAKSDIVSIPASAPVEIREIAQNLSLKKASEHDIFLCIEEARGAPEMHVHLNNTENSVLEVRSSYVLDFKFADKKKDVKSFNDEKLSLTLSQTMNAFPVGQTLKFKLTELK